MLKHISLFAACMLAFAGTAVVSEAQQRSRTASADVERHASIILRCTYWTQAGQADKEALFYKDGREFKPFIVTEMAFVRAYDYRGPLPFVLYRKATEQEMLKRKEEGVRGTELEYVPHAKINIPAGMRDVGVLIPGNIQTAKPVVFDFSADAFPMGSMMILNMTRTPVNFGLAAPKGKTASVPPQSAQLPVAGRWVTKPVKSRTVLNVRAAVPSSEEASGWKMAYASSAIFRETTRSVLFVLPGELADDGTPRLQFRQANVVSAPPPPPKTEDKKPKGRQDKNKEKEKEKKPPRRRV